MADLGLCVAGPKGERFVADLLAAGLRPAHVFTYPQRGDITHAHRAIAAHCARDGVACTRETRPNLTSFGRVFLVGWQYLVAAEETRCIVFHDSLLPRLRGFAPLPTALLAGERRLGVTALVPDGGTDTGMIVAQEAFDLSDDADVGSATEAAAAAMAQIALRLAAVPSFTVEPQNEALATYSLWRDVLDYFTDWRRTADDVLLHVRATGFPYEGAKAVASDGRLLRIAAARAIDDVSFAVRDPGKVWRIQENVADVVCGSGMVRAEFLEPDGRPARFASVRTRLLTADTAWLLPFASSRGHA